MSYPVLVLIPSILRSPLPVLPPGGASRQCSKGSQRMGGREILSEVSGLGSRIFCMTML